MTAGSGADESTGGSRDRGRSLDETGDWPESPSARAESGSVRPEDGGPIPSPRPGEDGVPWYVEGLRFECSACGKCCKNHGDGFEYVFSTRAERRRIASHLGLTQRAFEARYTERVLGSLSFVSKDHACVFLDERGQCSIYELRPKQCSTFPFWPELLESEGAWQRDVASFCPGVGQGDLHDVNAIRKRLAEWH